MVCQRKCGGMNPDASPPLLVSVHLKRQKTQVGLLKRRPLQQKHQQTPIKSRSAAHLVSRTRDHIPPILQKLHWLPVMQRIQFQILLNTHKAFTTSPLHTSRCFVSFCNAVALVYAATASKRCVFYHLVPQVPCSAQRSP